MLLFVRNAIIKMIKNYTFQYKVNIDFNNLTWYKS